MYLIVAAAGVKLFTFITIWCLLVVMPVNMTVRACPAASILLNCRKKEGNRRCMP
jgi:hypothetical protein